MQVDLPHIMRRELGGNSGVWMPFLEAAAELAGTFDDIDPREIEQLLFEGTPMLINGRIYVPETVWAYLLATAIQHGHIKMEDSLVQT